MKLVSRLRLLVPLSITCAAMLLGVSAVAQDSVWKCGNVLTDWPQGQPRQRCTEMSQAMAGFRGDVKTSALDRKPDPAKPENASRAMRDRDSRQILEAELASVTARRDVLKATLAARGVKSGNAVTPEDVQAQTSAQELNRLDIDVESLRREIARLPAEKAPVAQRAAQ